MDSRTLRTSSDWRHRAQEFARSVVAPQVDTIEATDRLPSFVVDQLAEAGFMGLGIPAELGGHGGDAGSLVAVLEEMAKVSATVATLLSVHLSVCAHPIRDFGSAEQRTRFLPPMARGMLLGAFALSEPGAGSDAAGISCRYERRDAEFRIQGSKMFITNGASAGILLLFATRERALGPRGISCFIVLHGMPGFSVAQRLDKLGLRGSETTELVLDNVAVPEDLLVGTEGEGLRIALASLTAGRVGIAACSLGVAAAAFEELRRIVRAAPEDWKRERVARAYEMVAEARALVERAAEQKDAGEPFVELASAAKLAASKAAFQIASTAVDLGGLSAARIGSTAERLFRDARVFSIVEGTTEIQELILGRSLVGD